MPALRQVAKIQLRDTTRGEITVNIAPIEHSAARQVLIYVSAALAQTGYGKRRQEMARKAAIHNDAELAPLDPSMGRVQQPRRAGRNGESYRGRRPALPKRVTERRPSRGVDIAEMLCTATPLRPDQLATVVKFLRKPGRQSGYAEHR